MNALLFAPLALCAIQDPVLTLSPTQTPTSANDSVLMVHDVTDLTGAAELALLPPLPTHVTGLTAARDLLDQFEERLLREKAVDTAAADLVEAIEAYMTPKIAKDQELRVHGKGMVLALLSPDQHTWMRTFLEQQRADADYIESTVKILSVPTGTLAALGVEGASKVFASDIEVSQILRGLEATPGVEIVTAPKVTTKPRQLANVSVTNQVAYIKDYKLEIVQPGDVVIADPVIDVVQDGLVLEMRSVPLADGKIGLDFDMKHSKLARPIQTMEVSLSGYAAPVTISLPHVTQIGVHTRVILAPGATALIVTPDQVEGREWAITIKLDRLDFGAPTLLPPADRGDR